MGKTSFDHVGAGSSARVDAFTAHTNATAVVRTFRNAKLKRTDCNIDTPIIGETWSNIGASDRRQKDVVDKAPRWGGRGTKEGIRDAARALAPPTSPF
jgi:hypothetical protein